VETYQERFIRVLGEMMTESGYELVHQPDWANTGTIDIVERGEFTPVVSFTYKFQTGHNVFESKSAVWGSRVVSSGTNARMYIARDLEQLGECISLIAGYVANQEILGG